jgi:hypothetical protein
VLRFEWNALRPGDHVLVHDPRTADMTLTDGVVTSVDTHKRVNGVGICVDALDGDAAILWPSPFVVHHDPPDPSEPCWRCQELGDGAAPPLDEPSGAAAVGADDAPRAEPWLSLVAPTATPT